MLQTWPFTANEFKVNVAYLSISCPITEYCACFLCFTHSHTHTQTWHAHHVTVGENCHTGKQLPVLCLLACYRAVKQNCVEYQTWPCTASSELLHLKLWHETHANCLDLLVKTTSLSFFFLFPSVVYATLHNPEHKNWIPFCSHQLSFPPLCPLYEGFLSSPCSGHNNPTQTFHPELTHGHSERTGRQHPGLCSGSDRRTEAWKGRVM